MQTHPQPGVGLTLVPAIPEICPPGEGVLTCLCVTQAVSGVLSTAVQKSGLSPTANREVFSCTGSEILTVIVRGPRESPWQRAHEGHEPDDLMLRSGVACHGDRTARKLMPAPLTTLFLGLAFAILRRDCWMHLDSTGSGDGAHLPVCLAEVFSCFYDALFCNAG